MAEQVMSKAIAKVVTDTTRMAIQTMAEKQAQSTPSTGPKLGSPILKRPQLQLGGIRQIHRMESAHSGGKKWVIYI